MDTFIRFSQTRVAILAMVLLVFCGLSPGQATVGSTGAPLTPVQQTATRNDAATVNGSSATSAATITIPAVGGLFFYLTGLDITNCAGASAVTAAAVTSITTTNLGSLAWTIGSGVAAGLCQPTISPVITTPIKAAIPGTAVTFVLPTFATNQTLRMNVYGYYAP